MRKNDGYILILVLIMILFLCSLVLLFGYESRIESELTVHFRDETKAYYLAKSAIDLAAWVIEADDPKTDNYTESWALGVFPFPLPEGEIKGQIDDESAKISLASLFPQGQEIPDIDFYKNLVRLFDILGYDSNILEAVLDWIDPDDVPRGLYGAEDNFYRSLKNPYETRNGVMESTYELFLIRGFTIQMILGTVEGERKLGFPDGLINYLTAYQTNKININTASLPVLAALNERMDRSEAEVIQKRRLEKPFDSVEEVKSLDISDSYKNSLTKYCSVNTDYFSVHIQGKMNDSRKNLMGVYHRENGSANLVYYREED
jgi:general secretion pathway protein K